MAIAGILAFQVVRTAAVRLSSSAMGLWPGHPDVMLRGTMAAVGLSAARGQTIPTDVLRDVAKIARKEPLTPEPFLILGALAQMSGRNQTSEQLYVAAANRDPRSPAARYFLAERFLRTGRVEAALLQMAVLSRLTTSAVAFAPAVAAYARTGGSVDLLRRFFRSVPEFEPVVLTELAQDARNVDLILSLWSGRRETANPEQSAWQAAIITRLVSAGEFQRAYAAWQQFLDVRKVDQGVFNPDFREMAGPPPFNWTFGSEGGLANPAGRGQLEVVYFGRDNAVLAQQVLLLPPGRYVLSMHVNGDVERENGVAWKTECIPDQQTLMTLPVRRPPGGRLQSAFSVPQGCRAQQLQLTGLPGDFPRTIEFVLRHFRLAKVAE